MSTSTTAKFDLSPDEISEITTLFGVLVVGFSTGVDNENDPIFASKAGRTGHFVTTSFNALIQNDKTSSPAE